MSWQERSLRTNDGIRLHCVDAGRGRPLVMLPGFSQTVAQFRRQVEDLSGDFRVIALDHRGHGRSDKPAHGYRVSRLAADLRDLILALDLHDVALLGHSMGCAVAWCYWDLYYGDRVGALILVDQPAVIAADLVAPEDARAVGAVFDAETAFGIAASLRGEDAVATSRAIVERMHTPAMSPQDVAWITAQNMLLPREYAAALLLDHYGNDWRDVLPRLDVPTLVIGGEASLFPPESAAWVASRIPGAQVRIFSTDERGSHLMFWENPDLFDSVVRAFLTGRMSP
ncbi:alpha/beta fold hydrolase [Streptomyces sp. NPDC057072]|uniref:alpha/beta fold hydrolase n=1 Tax=Streptomyces sp. NPDC057072 TaxID=3346014 RepID=UPI00362B3D84